MSSCRICPRTAVVLSALVQILLITSAGCSEAGFIPAAGSEELELLADGESTDTLIVADHRYTIRGDEHGNVLSIGISAVGSETLSPKINFPNMDQPFSIETRSGVMVLATDGPVVGVLMFDVLWLSFVPSFGIELDALGPLSGIASSPNLPMIIAQSSEESRACEKRALYIEQACDLFADIDSDALAHTFVQHAVDDQNGVLEFSRPTVGAFLEMYFSPCNQFCDSWTEYRASGGDLCK